MITLILGGASNGKSSFAEEVAVKMNECRYYIATMHSYNDETKKKIDVHRDKRHGKNFITIEQYKNINEVDVKKNSVILLECISNLLANETYDEDASNKENPTQKIISDIKELSNKCENLVIVSNEVFSDGVYYDEFCEEYINDLGKINCSLAKLADTVVEVVVGIPIFHKGEQLCTFYNQ